MSVYWGEKPWCPFLGNMLPSQLTITGWPLGEAHHHHRNKEQSRCSLLAFFWTRNFKSNPSLGFPLFSLLLQRGVYSNTFPKTKIYKVLVTVFKHGLGAFSALLLYKWCPLSSFWTPLWIPWLFKAIKNRVGDTLNLTSSAVAVEQGLCRFLLCVVGVPQTLNQTRPLQLLSQQSREAEGGCVILNSFLCRSFPSWVSLYPWSYRLNWLC